MEAILKQHEIGPAVIERPSEESVHSNAQRARQSSRQLRLATLSRRGVRRDEAATYVGISPSKFDQLVKDGRMPRPKRVDRMAVGRPANRALLS